MSSTSALLDLKNFSHAQFEKLFLRAEKLRKGQEAPISQGERLALLFFEPSTRTRMSFESAGYRCGLGPLVFDGGPNTSLEKGESVEDSILNIAAMKPCLIVVRCNDKVDLRLISKQVNAPMINAGWGIQGHPTQALLDAVTIQRKLGTLKGQRVLILGDIRHSRVAASHFELLPTLGAEVGVCGPADFLVQKPGVEMFKSLPEALKWANVAMALRVQFERHFEGQAPSSENYRRQFGLNSEVLKNLSAKGLILHPGPVNYGIEMEHEVSRDPRSQILEQVETGVYVREALVRMMLEKN